MQRNAAEGIVRAHSNVMMRSVPETFRRIVILALAVTVQVIGVETLHDVRTLAMCSIRKQKSLGGGEETA